MLCPLVVMKNYRVRWEISSYLGRYFKILICELEIVMVTPKYTQISFPKMWHKGSLAFFPQILRRDFVFDSHAKLPVHFGLKWLVGVSLNFVPPIFGFWEFSSSNFREWYLLCHLWGWPLTWVLAYKKHPLIENFVE